MMLILLHSYFKAAMHRVVGDDSHAAAYSFFFATRYRHAVPSTTGKSFTLVMLSHGCRFIACRRPFAAALEIRYIGRRLRFTIRRRGLTRLRRVSRPSSDSLMLARAER